MRRLLIALICLCAVTAWAQDPYWYTNLSDAAIALSFEEGSGTNVADDSGSGNVAYIAGTPSWTDRPSGGVEELSADTRYVYASDPTALNVSNQLYAYGGWCVITNLASGSEHVFIMESGGTFAWSDPGNSLLITWIGGGVWRNAELVGGAYNAIQSADYTAEHTAGWLMIVVTYDGTTRRLYRNGIQIASGTAGPRVAGTGGTRRYWYGAHASTSGRNLFGGVDDCFHMIGSTLTSQQVYKLWYDGTTNYVYTPPASGYSPLPTRRAYVNSWRQGFK